MHDAGAHALGQAAMAGAAAAGTADVGTTVAAGTFAGADTSVVAAGTSDAEPLVMDSAAAQRCAEVDR